MFLEDLFPHLPEAGPPVPSFLPKWPWVHNPATNPPQLMVDYEVIDAGIEELERSKRAEWEAKGYRPGLIDKALLWASEWTRGLLRSPLYTMLDAETRRRIAPVLYKEALKKAESYILAFME